MIKHGMIEENVTPPEVSPDGAKDKDLEQHFSKRAADASIKAKREDGIRPDSTNGQEDAC